MERWSSSTRWSCSGSWGSSRTSRSGCCTRPQQRRPAAAAGQWRVAHYDVKGFTRVVLQKVSLGGTNVLDEHVVVTIPINDPEYDMKFLAATATARERRAVFEAEEE